MNTTKARSGSPVRSLLLVVALLVTPAMASAEVFVSVAIAPPALPVYVQPPVPGPGYIWTPGYWGNGPAGYYWIPGTWVLSPYVGALWTPGYWGWGGAAFLWHGGYWGPHVGYYGGINYGFGYIGVGYHGGYWNGGSFSYNSAVTNVNVTNIHNTYNQPVTQNTALASRVSYNGGTGGVTAQPTADERLAERDQHTAPTQLQAQHQQLASTNRAQLASVNHGTPALAATPRAAAFRQQNAGGGGQPRNAASAQNASHPQGYGQNAASAQNASHPQGYGQNAAHAQAQPHVQAQPHPQVQPHPQAQPHPNEAEHEGHPR